MIYDFFTIAKAVISNTMIAVTMISIAMNNVTINAVTMIYDPPQNTVAMITCFQATKKSDADWKNLRGVSKVNKDDFVV